MQLLQTIIVKGIFDIHVYRFLGGNMNWLKTYMYEDIQ